MIFDEQISRKPDHYPWTEEFITAMHNGFWTDKEFNFQSDIQDFKTELTEQEREIVTRCLSAIGQIEVAVKTFWAKLGENLPHPSLTDLGYVMANVEVIHNNAYERLLRVLEMEHLFEENLKLDIIQGRVGYLRKYLKKHYKDARKQYVYSLILFTLYVENVSLFSQFYVVNWFNRHRNVLKDTAQQVAYTSREELIHALVGIKLPGLEFQNQRVEAAYRKELVYGEDNPDRAEASHLQVLFHDVRRNYFRLFFHYLYFDVAK